MSGSRSFGAEFSPFTSWVCAGSITAESTALAATGRAVATADATGATKVVVVRHADARPRAMLLRFRSDGSNNVDSVLNLYAARGPDDYTLVATLTITQGQQLDSGTIYFVDTIVATAEETLLDGEEGICTTDQIAQYYMRTMGFDRFLFQATDLDTTTVYIDMAAIYE